MQAAEKKIIIERGADFRIALEVVEGISTPKDISTFTAGMTIKHYDKVNDVIKYLQEDGTLTNVPYEFPGNLLGATPGSLGKFEIVIDKTITENFDPLLDMTVITDRFATDYNYFYNIDINDTGDSTTVENIRVLRGKCAVRN